MKGTRPTHPGALRIFLYNWPVYTLTWGTSVALLMVPLSGVGKGLAVGVAMVALAWSFFSLVVSHYVYDRSELRSGAWVEKALGRPAGRWVLLHAGLDAEVQLDGLGGTCLGTIDVYDPKTMGSPSIGRARGLRVHPTDLAKAGTWAATPARLPLEDGSCDDALVIFTAHEIRDAHVRETFFVELSRVLSPGGRVLLVEHLRDPANFAAFGVGFVHFLPRREWLRLAHHAKFCLASEARITPWVMALTLERT